MVTDKVLCLLQGEGLGADLGADNVGLPCLLSQAVGACAWSMVVSRGHEEEAHAPLGPHCQSPAKCTS